MINATYNRTEELDYIYQSCGNGKQSRWLCTRLFTLAAISRALSHSAEEMEKNIYIYLRIYCCITTSMSAPHIALAIVICAGVWLCALRIMWFPWQCNWLTASFYSDIKAFFPLSSDLKCNDAYGSWLANVLIYIFLTH